MFKVSYPEPLVGCRVILKDAFQRTSSSALVIWQPLSPSANPGSLSVFLCCFEVILAYPLGESEVMVVLGGLLGLAVAAAAGCLYVDFGLQPVLAC